MAATKTEGQQQKRTSAKGKEQAENLQKYYTRRMSPVSFNNQETRLTAIRPLEGNARIDAFVESFEVQDQGPALQGTMQFRAPDTLTKFELDHGHRIQCQIYYGGKWIEWWTMRVWDPTGDLSGSKSIPLFDDSKFLAESKDDWEFKRQKKGKYKKGWRCDQIAREVAKRYKFKLGKIAKGTKLITKLTKDNASPIDIIIMAYKEERDHSGRRFVIRWVRGRLSILPIQRNPLLYTLSDQIISGEPGLTRPTGFATAITIRGTVGTKRNKKKASLKVYSAKMVKKYGYIHKKMDGGKVDTTAELARKAKFELVRVFKPTKSLTLSHAGILLVRRGDAIRVSLPKHGYKGRDGILFVKTVSWSAGAGERTTQIETTIHDSYGEQIKEMREDQDKKKREAKKKKKKKST